MRNAAIRDRFLAAQREMSRRREEEVFDAWPAGEEVPDLEKHPELENDIEPDEESESEFEEMPCTDESHWDAFIPDEDECDPLPEEGDFWGIADR